MLGLNKKQVDESIKNPPRDDSYPLIPLLYTKNNGVGVNALSLTVIDLLNFSARRGRGFANQKIYFGILLPRRSSEF